MRYVHNYLLFEYSVYPCVLNYFFFNVTISCFYAPRKMFGDNVLGSLNIKMVDVARSVGAAAKFTGSGGAVVAFCPDGASQVELLEQACQEAGFLVQQIKVVPSVLTEEDLRTLSS